jgi:hypothetical protein
MVCRDLEIKDAYVGSTTNLSQRKKAHKSHCNNEAGSHYNVPVYVFIREHGGWDAWDIVQIEAYPCATKDELHARERYHIERIGASLNIIAPIRTFEERSALHNQRRRHNRREHKETVHRTPEQQSRDDKKLSVLLTSLAKAKADLERM